MYAQSCNNFFALAIDTGTSMEGSNVELSGFNVAYNRIVMY